MVEAETGYLCCVYPSQQAVIQGIKTDLLAFHLVTFLLKTDLVDSLWNDSLGNQNVTPAGPTGDIQSAAPFWLKMAADSFLHSHNASSH